MYGAIAANILRSDDMSECMTVESKNNNAGVAQGVMSDEDFRSFQTKEENGSIPDMGQIFVEYYITVESKNNNNAGVAEW